MIKNIAIIGGTFDPIHNGHTEMAMYIIKNNYADKVLIMPSYFSPHKDVDTIKSFNDRVNMINLAINGIDNIAVTTFEKNYFEKHNDKTYTYEVLNELSKIHPECKLNFVIGFDSIKNIHTWHNYKQLLKEYSFYIFDREDDELSSYDQKIKFIDNIKSDLNINFNYKLFDTKILNISSTTIRNLLLGFDTNRDLLLKYINKDVLNYIIENKLYGTK